MAEMAKSASSMGRSVARRSALEKIRKDFPHAVWWGKWHIFTSSFDGKRFWCRRFLEYDVLSLTRGYFVEESVGKMERVDE